MPTRQSSVEKLKSLLKRHPDLQTVLTTAIEGANENDIENLEQFYDLLDGMLTHIPIHEQLNSSPEKFWLILNKSTNEILKTETGYKYAQHAKPVKCPITDRCDNKIFVSPADSKYLGKWALTDDATVTVKGDTYNVQDLLAGSHYQRKFKGGTLTHSYLSVYDYYRYHTPVSGTVMNVKKIPGRTWINEIQKLTGKTVVDDIGFQFNQTRRYIIIKTNTIGFVAVVPVGMGFVSSVNITVEEGTKLSKGDEFGYCLWWFRYDYAVRTQYSKVFRVSEQALPGGRKNCKGLVLNLNFQIP